MPQVEYDKLTDDRLGETSTAARARVEKAREIKRARFGIDGGDSRVTHHVSRIITNADMGPAEVCEHCCGASDCSTPGFFGLAVQYNV